MGSTFLARTAERTPAEKPSGRSRLASQTLVSMTASTRCGPHFRYCCIDVRIDFRLGDLLRDASPNARNGRVPTLLPLVVAQGLEIDKRCERAFDESVHI